MASQGQKSDQPFQFSLLAIFVVTTVACVLFAHPRKALLAACSLAAMCFGLACVRAAVTNREAGWGIGLAFGALFTLIGMAACAVTVCVMFLPDAGPPDWWFWLSTTIDSPRNLLDT